MACNNQPFRTQGFTLLELLLVIALLAIIAAFTVSGFLAHSVEQQFRGAIAETALTIQETRQRTLAAETETQFGIPVSSSALTVFEGASLEAAVNIRSVVDGAALGVAYTPQFTAGTTTVRFARLTGTPNATGTILIRQIRSGATTTLTITEAGLIQY